jgi:hypothetical protein
MKKKMEWLNSSLENRSISSTKMTVRRSMINRIRVLEKRHPCAIVPLHAASKITTIKLFLP